MLTSSRPPTNPQGLVSTGPAIASEGLQVGVLVPAHRGLVCGLLVLVQDARVLEDLRGVAPQVAEDVGGLLCGLLCGPLRIPGGCGLFALLVVAVTRRSRPARTAWALEIRTRASAI